MKAPPTCRKPLCLLLLLAFAALSPYSRLLRANAGYLYDDYIWMELQGARNQHTLHDISRVCFKPTRPLANLFLGLGQWLGGGNPAAHRALSLLFHLTVVLLLFLNLCLFSEGLENPPSHLPFWSALLFAVHPLATEPIAIAVFQGRLLGTLFTLAGLLVGQGMLKRRPNTAQRRLGWGLIALFSAAASFSNEEFTLFFPLAFLLICLYPAYQRGVIGTSRLRNLLGWVLACQLVWGIILLVLFRRDPSSINPYQLGADFAKPPPLLIDAFREGIRKMLTGRGLSIYPPVVRARISPFCFETLAYFVALEWLMVGTWRSRRKIWYLAWLPLFVAALAFYLGLPNPNVGAERYLYFPLLCLSFLIVLIVHDSANYFAPRLASTTVPIALSMLGFCWFSGLAPRLHYMTDPLTLDIHEASAHPWGFLIWHNVNALLQVTSNQHGTSLDPILDSMKPPPDALLRRVTKSYLLVSKFRQASECQPILNAIRRLYPDFPANIRMLAHMNELARERAGDFPSAARYAEMANELTECRGRRAATTGNKLGTR